MVAAYDEAHLLRNTTRPQFHAHRALSQLAHFVVAVTATPVMTSSNDVVDLARMILVPHFKDHEADHIWTDNRRKEQAKRKEIKSGEDDEGAEPILHFEALRSFAGSGGVEDKKGQELLQLLSEQTRSLRTMLSPFHIRRENVFDSTTMKEEDRDNYPPQPIIVDVLVTLFQTEFDATNGEYKRAAEEGHTELLKKPSSVSPS
jgi:hypothetical protein